MPRNITVTLASGKTHVYRGVPDDVTPEQASARAEADFGEPVKALDGGRKPKPRAAPAVANADPRFAPSRYSRPAPAPAPQRPAIDPIARGGPAYNPTPRLSDITGLPEAAPRAQPNVADAIFAGDAPRIRQQREVAAIVDQQAREDPLANIPGETQIENTGMLDRARINVQKRLMSMGSGFARPIALGLDALGASSLADQLNIKADAVDFQVGLPLEGEQTVGDFIANPSLAGALGIVAEQGPSMIPDMGLMASGAGLAAYATQASGNIGQTRALNNDRQRMTGGDFVAAIPAGVGSTIAERLGNRFLLDDLAGGLAVRLGKAAVNEGLTEGAQSMIESTGGTLGTNKGFNLGDTLNAGLEGAVAGGLLGGAARGVVETGQAAGRGVASLADARAERRDRAAFAPVANAVAVDAFDPNSGGANTTSAAAEEAAAALVPQRQDPVVEASPVPDATGQQPGATAIPQAPSTGLRTPANDSDGGEDAFTSQFERVRVRREVVPADTLRAAKGETDEQNRSRTTRDGSLNPATENQVQSILANFQPEALGFDNYTDRGAPIVGEDGLIISGNARMIALNRLYDDPQYAQQRAAYEAFLTNQGYDIEGVTKPVLVRRTIGELPVSLAEIVRQSNDDTKLELTNVERARNDREIITPALIGLYAGGDIRSAANAQFVRQFMAGLPAGQQGKMFGDDRRLTTEGEARIANALLARAYDSPELFGRLIQSGENNIRSIGGALLDVAGKMAQFQAEVQAGNVRPEFDITREIVEASRRVADARTAGIAPIDILNQQDAFDQMSPIVALLIKAFHDKNMKRAVGRDKIGAFLSRYIEEASAKTTGEDLLGGQADVGPEQVLEILLASRDGDGADLFGVAAEDRGMLFDQGSPAPRTTKANLKGETADRALMLQELEDGSEPQAEEDTAEDAGPYEPDVMKVSFTNRLSMFEGAARALGLTPEQFRLLPARRQTALLARVIKERFNIEVKIDPQMNLRTAIDQMLDMIQNVQGMAHILGIGPKAISVGGNLVFEMQAKARYLGAFMPGENVIYLPGRSNSFAHEWGHALDFHLLELVGGAGRGWTGAVRAQRGALKGAPANVQEAFSALLNAMFFNRAEQAAQLLVLEKKMMATKSEKQRAAFQAQIDNIKAGSSQSQKGRSEFYKNAKAFDGPGGDYWQSPTEMFARAFEAYVSHRAELLGMSTEFIGKGDEAYLAESDVRLAKTFPKRQEREAIFAAFDQLFNQLNGGKVLGDGPRAELPSREDVNPVSNLDKLAASFPRSIIAREAAAWKSAVLQRVRRADKRAPHQLRWWQRWLNSASAFIFSMTGQLRMIQRRTNSPAVQAIIDKLTYAEGAGRLTGEGFLAAVERRRNQSMNRMGNAFRKHGFEDTLTAEEASMLRSLLIVPSQAGDLATLRAALNGVVNERMVALAADLRRILDAEWQENLNAGIDIGYVRYNYFPRMIDMPKVDFDNKGFLRQAALVYEAQFDDNFGEDHEAVLRDEEQFAAFRRLWRMLARAGAVDPDIIKPFNALLKKINALNRALQKSDDPDAIQAQIEQLTEQLTEAFGEVFDAARSGYGKVKSVDWLNALNTASSDDFAAHAPDGDYLKKRELPEEADALMEQFYISDPAEAITEYLGKSARRTEYERRFGSPRAANGKKPKQSIRQTLVDKMQADGVSREDQELVQLILDTATGRQKSGIPQGVSRVFSFVHAFGTMSLLARAPIASLAETFTAGIRTGSVVNSGRSFIAMVEGALGTASAIERREYARAIGLVSDQLNDDIMEARYGGQYGDITRWDKLTSAMFRKTQLTALTRAQRTHMLKVAHAYFDNLAGKVLGKDSPAKRDAIAELTELGVRDVVRFSKQLREEGRLPKVENLDREYDRDYANAARQLIDQIIQNPTVMDRPIMANNPGGRLIYGILSFSLAFWRNIIKRQGVLWNERRKRDGAAYATSMLLATQIPPFAILYLAQFMVSTAREYLLNGERWEEEKKAGTLTEKMLALAVTRTVSFGLLDPVVQAYSGLKYQRDLANIAIGAGPGFMLQAVQDVTKATVQNSPKTNSAEYAAVKGLYSMTISPALSFGLAAMPGGPITAPLQGAAIAFVTSPQARTTAATIAVGKKGSKTEGNFPDMGEVTPPKEKEASGQGDPAPWAFLDDRGQKQDEEP